MSKLNDDWDELDAILGGSRLQQTSPKPFNTPPVPVERKRVARRHGSWRIGNILMMARVTRNMSQSELAKRVGVSRQTIGAIENRRHEPVLSLGMAIAEALGVKVEDIFKLRRPDFSAYEKRDRHR
jgi:putative transcriptional regulator